MSKMNIHNEFHINSSKLGVRMDKIRVANLYGADFINTNKTKKIYSDKFYVFSDDKILSLL